MYLTADYHTHTNYGHGAGRIKDNIRQAIQFDLDELAITEHGPASHSLTRLGVKDSLQLLEIKEEIAEYNRYFDGLNLLAGVEANVINLEGRLDVPEVILNELDIVLAGLHLWIKPDSWQAGRRIIFDNTIGYRLGLIPRGKVRQNNTQALVNAVKRYDIDIITHPGYQLDINTYRLATVCRREDTCLEINNSHQQLSADFIDTAASTGVEFAVNSDAHTAGGVGRVDSALELINEAELDLDQVINVT
ncbi:PHP domain-containing protein [Acetohalobium arabaticum]|uniref:PHP domain protein n=1 Tax=Acetohalobium arabaticum (strain ATCC 49924 / DSM 5501 / Z-7288) TaxID=574087 RepID=D9QU72_ACEAZ|nr:PHP domain-containing protein [Acetohalobium arabaticum]ADL11865.1 PHP domain protein [Acetohalobium arabaticum DSM 5501]